MSFRYDSAKSASYDGSMLWPSDTFRAVLLNLSLYAPSPSHVYLSDIPAGARSAISGPLANKSNVAGVLNCDPFQFTAVSAGPACAALAIYKDTGTPGTSKLFLYLDSALSGLPATPNGADIVVTPDTGVNKLIQV
jgi:hypothetical protein